MIYLKLMGRIGNQLFMYGAAKAIQKYQGENQTILIEDCNNVAHDNPNLKYENSLMNYHLPNVQYIHDLSEWRAPWMFTKRLAMKLVWKRVSNMDFRQREVYELKTQPFLQKMGIFCITNGYTPYPITFRKNTYVFGYFQSPRFMEPVREELIELYSLRNEVNQSEYPHLDEIRSRNTVCISIKVQHNVGNPMYDVCGMDYYERAIKLITERVENPLFFICSDNVDYVVTHLVDPGKYDVVFQDNSYPVHISLAVMAQSKHFIIGNTTFAWWAQYLCTNPDKIVIAPSRWYGMDVPCDIYMDDWILVEV